MSPNVKVFGCRPITTVPRAPGPAYEQSCSFTGGSHDQPSFDGRPCRRCRSRACRGADLAQECAAIIATDGPVVRTPQGVKDHPLLRHELTARAFVVRTISRLGLDIEPVRSQQ